MILIVMLAAAPAFAQERVAISGTVTDPSGGVVPGAIVDATAAGQPVASSTTGQDGRYRLEVPAGSYQLRARLLGFADGAADVTASAAMTRDITLAIAAIGDRLVVTAARTAETRANATASVAVLSADDIEALGGSSLADVFRAVPGLYVESNGREGALASLFSRGGESDYNLVLIDGVRVNNTGGTFDFSRVSAAEIDRVEIVRGGQSALYGSDAMGAVVQVFTRRAAASDAPRLMGSIEGGSFDTWRGQVRVAGGAAARVDYQAGVAYRGTEGAFHDLLPEHDRFDQASYDAGVGASLGDRATLRTSVRYSNARGRASGPISYQSRDTGTGYETKDLSWRLDLMHRLAPRLTGTGRVSYSRSDAVSVDAIADPSYNLYAILEGTPGARFPASPRLVRFITAPEFQSLSSAGVGAGQFLVTTLFGVSDFPFTSPSKFRRPGFKYQADWTWRDDASLAGGYELEKESDPLNAGFRVDNHAYFAQQSVTIRDRWFLSVGGRVDANSHFGTSVSPKLSVGGHPRPLTTGAVSSVKVFANAGKGIKNPLFGELFGSAFTDGNRELSAERARTIDAGAELTLADQRIRTTVTYFDNRYRDQVAYRSSGGFGPDGLPDFINIAGSKARGWELEGSLQRPVGGLTVTANYAFVDTEVTATISTSEQFQPGQPLLRRPKHAGMIRASYSAGRATLNLDTRFVGQRHDATFIFGLAAVPGGRAVDITVNPGYMLVGLGAEYRARPELTVFARIDNLMDETYESALGFPGLPRALVGGARFVIGGN